MSTFSRLPRRILLLIALAAWVCSADAGVVTFTDINAFLAAAGNAHVIDFETLPDGSPSVSGTEITPEFNYGDQGVVFSSAAPPLAILQRGEEFFLGAGNASEPPNWIVANLVIPASAIGIVFPGHTTLYAFDDQNRLIGSVSGGGSGVGFFVGIISDAQIYSAIGNRGSSIQSVDAFFFTPIPEPGSLLLLVVGAVCWVRRSD